MHQNVKSVLEYRVIKFNFKYVPLSESDPRHPLANKFFITSIYNISKWHLGSSGGNRVIEAKEISIQLKT